MYKTMGVDGSEGHADSPTTFFSYQHAAKGCTVDTVDKFEFTQAVATEEKHDFSKATPFSTFSIGTSRYERKITKVGTENEKNFL